MADIAARLAGKWRIMATAIWDKQHPDLCGPACGSACKKNPVSGVIGVQKGTTIPMV